MSPAAAGNPVPVAGLEAALAGVLRRSRLAIVVAAGDASVVWANGAALQLLPTLDPRRNGANLRDVVDIVAAGDDWPRVADALIARMPLPALELPLHHGRWLRVEVQPLGQEADPRLAAALVLHDVTQRRLARERARVEDELKREASRLGRVGAWEYDVATDTVRWSDEMFAIHGLAPVAAPDKRTFIPLYDTPSRERWLAAFQAAVGSGRAINLDLDFVTPKGEARHVHALGRALWRNGRVVGIAGVIHDDTAAHAARQAIAELRDRLRLATQAIGAGVWEWHVDVGRIGWDEQMYRLYGLPPGDGLVDERTWAHAIHPDDFLRTRDDARTVIQGRRQHIDHHFRIVWPDGDVRHIQSVGSRIDTPQGRRIVGINFDVTDRERRVQSMLEKQAAERASRAKSELLSRASHELRTPMNAVLGFAQLLQLRAAELPPWAGDAVRQLRSAGTHLLAMIDDLLDLAAVESGSLALRLAGVPLDDAVEAVLDLMRPQADAAGVRLGRWARCGLAVHADATRLRQVLLNLVGNAIKFNAAGGRVDVLLEPWSGDVAAPVGIVVRDDGPGIATERQHQLFQPFNRLDAQAREVPGHGLGLVISRQLADVMHGSLELRSTPGVGTEAVLRLPRGMPITAVAPVPAVTSAATALPAAGVVRVLCVEDNPVNALLMREALALRPSEIDLRLADSGERGLEVLASWRPDLVLLDLSLPGIDGHEVLRRLRAQPDLADLPCVAVSADAMPQQIARARAAGFDDYWVKPLDIPTLADRVLRYAPERPRSG
ncbi:MAG TPA: ATP-binding protein [Burkholderiaceae bacterium]|nr:ATP-binding protein [Burkholderiaceae bacterium]